MWPITRHETSSAWVHASALFQLYSEPGTHPSCSEGSGLCTRRVSAILGGLFDFRRFQRRCVYTSHLFSKFLGWYEYYLKSDSYVFSQIRVGFRIPYQKRVGCNKLGSDTQKRERSAPCVRIDSSLAQIGSLPRHIFCFVFASINCSHTTVHSWNGRAHAAADGPDAA